VSDHHAGIQAFIGKDNDFHGESQPRSELFFPEDVTDGADLLLR
jgi:hypothetical protein